MRLLLLALALGAPLLLAPAQPARCAFCIQDDCMTSSECGHGCFCLKKGIDIRGECYSSD